MKAMICSQCGGSINRVTMRCEYCGTRYFEAGGELRVMHYQGQRPEVLHVDVELRTELLASIRDAHDVSRLAYSEITRRLAEALEPYVEYEIRENPFLCTHQVRGRVRVLPPAFKFTEEAS